MKAKKLIQILEPCKICNNGILYAKLGGHLRTEHKTTKIQYLKDYVYVPAPLCRCGCKTPLKIRDRYPYIPYNIIKSHIDNSGKNNSMYGKTHSEKSKEQMKNSAIKRIVEHKEDTNKPLPMHTPEAIAKRALKQREAAIINNKKKYNVDIITWIGNVHFKCNKCGTEHYQGHNSYFICSKCFPKIRSIKENDLVEELNKLGLTIRRNNRTLIDSGELDIYIQEHGIAIEFDGLYWHGQKNGNKFKNYHLQKTIECAQKDIHLIHIFEDEWDHKKPIIISRLKHLFGLTKIKIYGRKCIIKQIESSVKNEFLDINHIQGKDISKYNYGAFYKNKLVAVMTFSTPSVAKGASNITEGEFELSRFCTKLNTIINGIGSKILSQFISDYNPSYIFSYADRRWTKQGSNIYESIGFKYISTSAPNYWYFKVGERPLKRYHRFNFTKQKLIKAGHDPKLTEWQIMQSIGYDKIYDCGNYKFEWRR